MENQNEKAREKDLKNLIEITSEILLRKFARSRGGKPTTMESALKDFMKHGKPSGQELIDAAVRTFGEQIFFAEYTETLGRIAKNQEAERQ